MAYIYSQHFCSFVERKQKYNRHTKKVLTLSIYAYHILWCSSPWHQTTRAHTPLPSSQYDKWTSPWRVNNKVIQPQPYQSLSLSGIESHRLQAAEIQLLDISTHCKENMQQCHSGRWWWPETSLCPAGLMEEKHFFKCWLLFPLLSKQNILKNSLFWNDTILWE